MPTGEQGWGCMQYCEWLRGNSAEKKPRASTVVPEGGSPGDAQPELCQHTGRAGRAGELPSLYQKAFRLWGSWSPGYERGGERQGSLSVAS